MNNKIQMIKVNSSNIASIGYDKTSMQLHVCFKKNNSLYIYDKVSIEEFNGLLNSQSKGKYFHNNIKNGGYHFTKVK